jgi:predicted nuclease with TOPRIM domain
LQKKAQTLRERIARRQAEKEEHVGASHQRTADRQNLCETLQSNEAETERLARSLKELQNRSEEIRARQIELDEADRTGVGATLEIDRMITRDEHDLKILSDAANL